MTGPRIVFGANIVILFPPYFPDKEGPGTEAGKNGGLIKNLV